MKLSKYRYLELKYFSMQYSEFKEEAERIYIYEDQSEWSDPTSKAAIKLKECTDAINLIEKCAENSDLYISKWVLLAVTEGLSFTTLKMRYGLPCERDMFYSRRKKYFMLLDILK